MAIHKSLPHAADALARTRAIDITRPITDDVVLAKCMALANLAIQETMLAKGMNEAHLAIQDIMLANCMETAQLAIKGTMLANCMETAHLAIENTTPVRNVLTRVNKDRAHLAENTTRTGNVLITEEKG